MNIFRRFKKQPSFWPSLSWGDVAVLGAGVAAFVAIAAATVTKFSIWFDEAFGSYLIRFDVWNLTRYTAYDVHPPFYYWLLKIWSTFFGNTELGIRSMSIFFGVVTIVSAFMLVVKLFGRKAAYVSLLFLVLSPLFIRYGQEARMYTLLTAIIVAATYVLVYALQVKQRWPWVVYGVLLAIGMLTQYFAALAWLSHWVWRAIVVKRDAKSFKKAFFSKNWMLAHIVAIGVFLPWLPWMIRQFADVQGNGFWIPPVTSTTVPDYLTNILLFTNNSGAVSWLAAAFYGVLAVLIFIVSRLIGSLKGDRRDAYLLLVVMVVAPVVLLLILSMPPLRPAFVDRYLMASIVFLPLLVGVSIVLAKDVLRTWVRVALGGIIVLMMGVGIYNQSIVGNYNKYTHQSNDVRQLIEKVRAETPSGVPILAHTPWIFYEAAIYERAGSSIYFIDETTKYEYGSLRMLLENDDHKIRNLDAFVHQHKSFWVISNIKDGTPNDIRESWRVQKEIIINDALTDKPLFRAAYVTAE